MIKCGVVGPAFPGWSSQDRLGLEHTGAPKPCTWASLPPLPPAQPWNFNKMSFSASLSQSAKCTGLVELVLALSSKCKDFLLSESCFRSCLSKYETLKLLRSHSQEEEECRIFTNCSVGAKLHIFGSCGAHIRSCTMLLMHGGWRSAWAVYGNAFNCSADFKDN